MCYSKLQISEHSVYSSVVGGHIDILGSQGDLQMHKPYLYVDWILDRHRLTMDGSTLSSLDRLGGCVLQIHKPYPSLF